MASPQAVETAVRTMREVLSGLEKQRSEIDTKMDQLRVSIKSMERELATQTESSPPMRRPRGQNLADVRAFFARFPGRGFTPTTIGQEVGIPPTSVQAVLAPEENGFEQRDGLWYAKEQDPPFDDPFAAPSTRKIGQG